MFLVHSYLHGIDLAGVSQSNILAEPVFGYLLQLWSTTRQLRRSIEHRILVDDLTRPMSEEAPERALKRPRPVSSATIPTAEVGVAVHDPTRAVERCWTSPAYNLTEILRLKETSASHSFAARFNLSM